MIKFADKHSEAVVRNMWKICFEDTDEFIDLYFSQKYKEENTLIFFEGDIAAASVQMLPYTINFYGEEIPFSYISGACTLPEYRKKGYMEKLLIRTFCVMLERNIPLSILIPAEDWLYGFYSKYGYTKTFDNGTEQIPIREILDKHSNNVEAAYKEFDFLFRSKNLCIQKSPEDFYTIVDEYKNDGYPPKYNLSGMARIIDVNYLLSIFEKKHPDKSFSISVLDPLLEKNNNTFSINKGGKKLEMDISMLTRLLFGFHTNELSSEYSYTFEEQSPIMNLMLE